MSVNIPNHFVEQFTTNVQHLLQIAGGKFRMCVTEGGHVGEAAAAVDQIGKVEMQEVTSRFQPMGRVDAATDRVWVYPTDYSLPQMIDTFDKARLLLDPQGYYAQAAVKAHQRKIDDVIADAFFADAKTGKSGGTTDSFDTTSHRVDAAIGAAADTGMNVDKIIRGKRLLRENNVDLEAEEIYMSLTAKQEEDLLRQTQVISTDYLTAAGGAPILKDGKLDRIAGVNIIHSELTPSNSSYRLNPMWVKSGMYLGVWNDVSSRVDPRPDIEGVPMQLYSSLTIGATRLEAGRVIQIECTES